MRHLILLSLLATSSALSAEPSTPDTFNAIFASTCMQNYYSQDKLRENMKKEGFETLAGDQAEFFLGGSSGTAWIIVTSGTRYVVSLRSDSVCSVFAQQADQKRTQSGFADLVQSAPSPLIAKMASATGLGPNTDETKTIAYTWSRPADASELLFVLTTSTSSKATAQAMASMSVVKKEG